MNITAIIMASGYSKRMGKDKLFLSYKNKTFIEHIIDKVKNCNFYSSIIVAKDDKVINLAEHMGIKAVKNEQAYKGQSEAIKLGIMNSPDSDGYMFFTADQPLLDINTIQFLMNSFNKNSNCIIIPSYKGRRGSPVIFSSRFLKELKELQGDVGGKKVIDKNKNSLVFVNVKKEEVLMDIDNIEDYGKLMELK